MDFVTLSNGVKMPVLGFGVFKSMQKKRNSVCLMQYGLDTV